MHYFARYFFSTLILCSAIAFQAQENIGLNLSNYLPLSSSQINPALAADSKTRFDIHLVGAAAYGTNQHVYLESSGPGLFKVLMGAEAEFGEDIGRQLKDGYLDLSIEGPGVLGVFGRLSVGLSSRYRAMANVSDVPFEMTQFIHHGLDYLPLQDSIFSIRGMSTSAMAWGELNFTIAHMLEVTEDHHMNVGLTLKRLFGQAHAGLRIDRLNYMSTAGDLYIDDFSGGYSMGIDDIGDGNGWAADLGLVYRKIENGSSDYVPFSIKDQCYKSSYRYEVGVSLLDFGRIRFDQNSGQVQLVNSSSILLDYDEVDVNTADNLDELLETMFENDQNQFFRQESASVSLPSALSVQFDYNFENGLHLGAVAQHPIKGSRAYSLRRARILGVIPRYESKYLEASIPISMYEFERIRIGMAFRILGLTIGSDDIGAVLVDGDLYSMDLYASLRIPILYRSKCRTGIEGDKNLIAPCWGQ
ncbi:MAG: hypothetical protein HKN45_11375 [Flavobacteriales bacterium]|nr:hypothetical protein [Flavobacteriales bacterium]